MGTGHTARGHQAVALSCYKMAVVLWFKRGRPCCGEEGRQRATHRQHYRRESQWEAVRPGTWRHLEWLLSLSSPLKTCSHWFSFSASEGDHCLLCLHRDISHHGLLVLLHHHLLKLMPCTPEKLSTRVTRNGDYTYAQTSKLKQFLRCPVSTLQKHTWVEAKRATSMMYHICQQ